MLLAPFLGGGGVGGGAARAVFLVGENHAAQRVAGLQAERPEKTQHFHRLHDAGAVVMRTGRVVP